MSCDFTFRARGAVVDTAGRAFGVVLPRQACSTANKGVRAALWIGPDEWLLIGPRSEKALIERQLTEVLTGDCAFPRRREPWRSGHYHVWHENRCRTCRRLSARSPLLRFYSRYVRTHRTRQGADRALAHWSPAVLCADFAFVSRLRLAISRAGW